MTKRSMKFYVVAGFHLLFSLWSLALQNNHNLLFGSFSVIGILGAIVMVFHARIGGALLFLFYLPQTIILYGETWHYAFSPGFQFSFGTRSGSILDQGSGISINIFAIFMIITVYRICFKAPRSDEPDDDGDNSLPAIEER